ncbi:MAG: enoyl-CoA hydratase/isomerase family protein [Planctomycetota bacterium]
MTATPVRCAHTHGGSVWHVHLDAPPGNVIDSVMTRALDDIFVRAAKADNLRAVILEGEGDHFSFGASVQDHLPTRVHSFLPAFHDLFRRMFAAHVPVLAVVRGYCLGGGLELATFCHRIFASPTAQLGQPEIRLGVFAPVASVLLPERIGRSAAEELCLSGRIVDAREALALGLMDGLADDPLQAAHDYIARHWQPHSISSLRHAVRAIRADLADHFERAIATAETHYREELMTTHDAVEGVAAFLEKRPPDWRNR